MKYQNIQEEEIKNKITIDYFKIYNCTKIIGDIDFCVAMFEESQDISEQESLLWAEAKTGNSDVSKSITQLILTIGKAKTFSKYLPPNMLGAFDGEKIAFVPYNEINDIFYMNDFNWNVTPSNHNSREFKLIHEKVKNTIDEKALLFYYEKDDTELNNFIKDNFKIGKFGVTKTRIDKNNFITIYNKWLQTVKPTIAINWDLVKKNNIIDGDFYLADLLSTENKTLKDSLYVLLKTDYYQLDRKITDYGLFTSSSVNFIDNQKAHTQFWNKYERPPKQEYWDYIVARRDLLVPQDVRERKGSFFTPQIWVELSQKYLTDVLGVNWQDEYYIWDCAAGTGNLLAGLTNKFNIYASTLDKQDIDVIHDRIKNGANLAENNVFQFDFLNDDFKKLPESLQDIINDPEKRKKLVVYINPPYAEASSYGKESIPQVANETKIFHSYKNTVGAEAMNELFAQFFIRVCKELPESILASFSTPKFITSKKFSKFRNHFRPKYKKGFICKSDTFDNVEGKFPIGFFIWDLEINNQITKISTDIFLSSNDIKSYWNFGAKKFSVINNSIADWRKTFYNFKDNPIGYMIIVGPSMQSNNNTFITSSPVESYINKGMVANISVNNITEMSIYLSVRQVIEPTWINNKDPFLYPKDSWKKDKEFQNDCIAFTLFHGQNKITSKDGANHWIPFTEYEVNAKERFKSDFMAKFIAGKLKISEEDKLLIKTKKVIRNTPLVFSKEAKEVFEAGLELWKYYHSQTFPNYNGITIATGAYNANASLYDIREYFQGRNESGKMNHKGKDENYTKLIGDLREKLKLLADKIAPKVYEHVFLLE